MYDENNNNVTGGFEQGSSTYHYSYMPQQSPTPPTPEKPRKTRWGLKAAALVLCCAIVGGAAIYSAAANGGSGSQ